MSDTKTVRVALALLALSGLLAPRVYADGPLIVDPKTRTGFHFGSDPVPIYYDLGSLGIVWDYSTPTPTQVVYGNKLGAHLVKQGYAEWSGVATSSLRTEVKGDFSLKGLPDIDNSNVNRIIGTSNGRGIYVIFDADGSILQNVLGAPDGVLGVSSPQFAIEGTTIITESWVVLNGSVIDPHDTGAAAFQGVATHEFGHSLGLAHTQVNGAAVFYHDGAGPDSCTALPYAGSPTPANVETMYPYIDPTPVTGTGAAQGRVQTLDAMAAISDLYPGPQWPEAYGTIEGKVYDLDGRTELTGVNVIVRNLADPYEGATSALSGQLTQGLLGPDGSFVIHGLKPGRQYVLYVDAIMAGGFPTPPLWFLPGKERFYVRADAEQDSSESRDHTVPFNPCRYSVVTAQAGQVMRAPIKFQQQPGAPMLYQLGYGTGVTGLSGDGSIAVGDFGRGAPIFRWTAQTGAVPLPGALSTGEISSISPNGRYISSNLYDPNTDSALGAHRWDAVNGWLAVAPTGGSCDTDTVTNFSIDDYGSVYGIGFTDNTCTAYHAVRWNPGTGSVILPSPGVKPDGTPANTRINKASAHGETLVGWQEDPQTGIWEGVVWNADAPSFVLTAQGGVVDEVTAVSGDGALIAGALLDSGQPVVDGYRRRARGGPMEWIYPLPGDSNPASPNAMSKHGDVMVGFSGNPWLSLNPGPFIWTRELGAANLDDFARRQGTAMEQWASLWEPTAVSDDGKVIAGWGNGFLGPAGWVLRIDSVLVCHHDDDEPKPGRKHAAETLSVAFPGEFDEHLAHGDTVGRCP
jgi:hypothetical protein